MLCKHRPARGNLRAVQRIFPSYFLRSCFLRPWKRKQEVRVENQRDVILNVCVSHIEIANYFSLALKTELRLPSFRAGEHWPNKISRITAFSGRKIETYVA